MKGGKVESGTAQRKPCGSNLLEATEGKAPWTRNKGKWTGVSANYRVLDALVKEKKITWTRSGKESAKREADLYHMREKAATNEMKEGRDRDKLGDKLEAFLTREEREDVATGLMEEMRKKVVAAQQKKCENMSTDTTEIRTRPGTLMTKCWQSMQIPRHKEYEPRKRLGTKAMKAGWCEEEKTRKLWAQDEGSEQKAPQP